MLSIKCRYDGEWCKSLQWNKCREQFVIAGVELVTKVKSNRKTWQRKYTVIKVEFHFIESGSHPETESEIEIVTSPPLSLPAQTQVRGLCILSFIWQQFQQFVCNKKGWDDGLEGFAIDQHNLELWLVDRTHFQAFHWPMKRTRMWWGRGY